MHPTQVFLSNPQALRAEYRLDDQRLELWWSPLAGESTDCLDRNYSNRDAHLDVFGEITIPGCGLDSFLDCQYDPYYCALRFKGQTLHLAMAVDCPAVCLWAERGQTVDFKTCRFDQALEQSRHAFAVRHDEGRRAFEFAARLGSGGGVFRHCHFHGDEYPYYAQAQLAAGQALVIGVQLLGGDIRRRVAAIAEMTPAQFRGGVENKLKPVLTPGRTRSAAHPRLEQMRDQVVRCLHSMIDESGAFRASLKAIYYLIWVRDGGFAFSYQAAAGWPHKLPEFCRLLLDNPLETQDPGLPPRRMFGQLINRVYGKREEDGIYYVVWTLFTHWTQFGHLDFITAADWELVEEALAWVEEVTWDERRGLYGEFTADETPAHGSRDMGWDYAIGQPGGEYFIRHNGRPVGRNYDVYFNTCMHSAHAMLAAMRNDPGHIDKCRRVWPELKKLLDNRADGVPAYGELLLTDGARVQPPYWGPAAGASCCVWGLTMPNFLPLADRDAILAAAMDAIIAKPEMHFVNGICSAMAAVDTWVYPEEKLLELHHRLAEETSRPGKYLPMGGAMPEKFNAPQGNLHHDIRPQGFAMGAWLAAWSSLGLRRLPYGLALRPTIAFELVENYPWRGRSLSFQFGPTGRGLALEVDGQLIRGTLQVPEAALSADGAHVIRLVEAPLQTLWLRSSVQLVSVNSNQYRLAAHGLSQITFSADPGASRLLDDLGASIPCGWSQSAGLHTCHFTHFGAATLTISL